MKMVAGLTHDIKRYRLVQRSFDSPAKIAEEVRINVSQFISTIISFLVFCALPLSIAMSPVTVV